MEYASPALAVGNSSETDQVIRRHSSLTDVPLNSNVLRKVASLTLDSATLDLRINKPRCPPEKLEYMINAKFEGAITQIMLLNLFAKSLPLDKASSCFP